MDNHQNLLFTSSLVVLARKPRDQTLTMNETKTRLQLYSKIDIFYCVAIRFELCYIYNKTTA